MKWTNCFSIREESYRATEHIDEDLWLLHDIQESWLYIFWIPVYRFYKHQETKDVRG